MSNKDWDDMTEEEQRKATRQENGRLRRKTRRIREAVLDKITKDKNSEEFPNLDGSNKQVYAIVAVADGMDRDVAESEKVLAQNETNTANAGMVNVLFEALMNKAGNPAAIMANGERGTRTVGTSQRLRPNNQASEQHMKRGSDDIDYEQVFDNNQEK